MIHKIISLTNLINFRRRKLVLVCWRQTSSNIAVGMARVATALGESTIPDILPSHGQHDSKRYTCIKSPMPDVKIIFTWHDNSRQNRRIGPQLWSEGQLHPSTFKLANIVPQLSFLGQTHPYVDIILYNNIIILHNNMRFMKKILFTLGSFPFKFCNSLFFTKKIFNQCKSHSVVASIHLEAEHHKCLIWNIEVYLPMHRILLRMHRE
jgi:hypothetical protein